MQTSTYVESAHEDLRSVLDATPIGMILTDSAGRIALVNEQAAALFGYSSEELLGKPVEALVPERYRQTHPHSRALFAQDPKTRAMGHGRDLFALRKDGSEVPVEIGLNPFTTPNGTFVLSSIADISERKRSMRELEQRSAALAATLQEREILLQEIHHRVKNNLQIIASLINMQIRKLDDPHSRSILYECKTRVDAIALIHAMLYQSRDFANIPFASYARGLISTIFQAAGLSSFDRVTAKLDIDDVALPVDQAIPCGLIVNELVTNAIKHAFPENRPGSIRVALKRANPGLVLEVSDDGIGMGDLNVDEDLDSIGLHLVTNLADQLNGTLHMQSTNGLSVAVQFPQAN